LIVLVSAKNGEDPLPSIKGKRGVDYFGHPTLNLDSFNANGNIRSQLWNPAEIISPLWDSGIMSDLTLGKVQLQATHNLALQVSYYQILRAFSFL
jgi:hypothetical protein